MPISFPICQPRTVVMCAATMLSIFAATEAVNRAVNQTLLKGVVDRTLDGFATSLRERGMPELGKDVELTSSGAVKYSIRIASSETHPIFATAQGQSPTIVLKYLGLRSLPIQVAVDYSGGPRT